MTSKKSAKKNTSNQPYLEKMGKIVTVPLKNEVPAKYLNTTKYKFLGIGPTKSRQEFRKFQEITLVANPTYTKKMMNKAVFNFGTLKTNNTKKTAKYSIGKLNTRRRASMAATSRREKTLKSLRRNINNNNNNNYNNNNNNGYNNNKNNNYNERTEYARSLITGLPSANLKKMKELRNKTRKNLNDLSKLLNKMH